MSVEKGQVYDAGRGREMYILSDPEVGTVRGRRVLSVDTLTERGNRTSVKSLERRTPLREKQCFGCWRGVDHVRPIGVGGEDHDRTAATRTANRAKWAAERAARQA